MGFTICQRTDTEICLEAVKKNGRALEFVKEQTSEICLEAVKKNGYALKFVKEQTPEICLEAVKQNGRALEFVKNIQQRYVSKLLNRMGDLRICKNKHIEI